ncbi:MAG: peptide-methionine (S)-S-oxide reductase MsrA [Candidatus Zixiibacteriota bacterium]
MTKKNDVVRETATFGAGCFWGVEAAFRQIPGVISTAAGFAGGHVDNPTYRQVCDDNTGHAEVVQVIFDPSQVSYRQLLDLFWQSHDPTQLDRQGPDIGSQYRSVVFYHSEEQRQAALNSKDELAASDAYASDIVTQIEPAGPFYLAEEQHQQYLEKRGLSTCRINTDK